jgi:hypothetical protein
VVAGARALPGPAERQAPAEAMGPEVLVLPVPKTEPAAVAAAGLRPEEERPTAAAIPKVRAELHL